MADNPHFNRISTAFQKAVNHIHRNKGYKPEMLADGPVRELITATCDTLTEPLHNIGLRQEVPPELTAAIDENTFYFSGFKTHHELVEASRLLKGDDGNFKPFEQFRRDVEAIDSTYNRNYLQAEYNFAAAASQMAVKWKEWEQDGDDYDLQYRTAGDDRVREEHAALDGITLPPSDPFWNSYLPPNGWNCRCTTVQVRKGKYPQSDPEEAAARGAACTARPKQQIFRFNPGKQQKIFPPKHPYFPKGCGNCQYKQLDYNPSSTQCQACRAILQNIEKEIKRREENRKECERLKKDSDYTEVEYDEASGGMKATHVGHRFESQIGCFGIERGEYEKYARDALFRKGYSVILQKEDTNSGTVQPDGFLNGVLMDIKGVEGNPMWSINRACTQKVETCILYFHDHASFSEVDVRNKFLVDLPDWRNKQDYIHDKEMSVKTVVCVVNRGDYYDVIEIKKPEE